MGKPLAPPPKFTIYYNGLPASGAKIYTYEANSSTPKATYLNNGGTLNENPIVCDTRGECDLRLTEGEFYKIVAKTSTDVTIWTVDYVSALGTAYENLTVTGTSNLIQWCSFPLCGEDEVVTTNHTVTFPLPAGTIVSAFASVGNTQSSSGAVVVNCKKFPDGVLGNSIFSTAPSITAGDDHSTNQVLDSNETTLASTTKMQAYVTSAGTGATGVSIQLRCRWAT